MFTHLASIVRGAGLPALPVRVQEEIAHQQGRSERIISMVQIAIVVLFGGLFLISPVAAQDDIAF